MRLDNKVALITGAASGFGKGIAEVFAREGARVALADINESGARAAAAAISNSAVAVACVTNPQLSRLRLTRIAVIAETARAAEFGRFASLIRLDHFRLG